MSSGQPEVAPPAPSGEVPTTSAVSGRRGKLRREAVDQALAEAGGNKVKAAKILGVGRATLYRFFKTDGGFG